MKITWSVKNIFSILVLNLPLKFLEKKIWQKNHLKLKIVKKQYITTFKTTFILVFGKVWYGFQISYFNDFIGFNR